MSQLDTHIKTRDGNCPASIFTPSNGGPWPAVIFYMDAFGIRPSLRDMAARLAASGYLVLLPDLYYRSEDRPAHVPPAKILADAKLKEEMMAFVRGLDREHRITDATAFIDFLVSRPDVKAGGFGAVGYCMGGNIALTAAGAFPGRFAAVASFHGGNLANDKPDSPHLFVKNIKGRVYIGCAADDATFPLEQQERLASALNEAKIDHVIETYDARHGFAVPDSPAFDLIAAEHHWQALAGLLAASFA